MFLSKVLVCFLLQAAFVHQAFTKPTANSHPIEPPEEKESTDTFEGDMKLTPEQQEEITNQIAGGTTKRKAINNLDKRWLNGVIPYEIRDESSGDRDVIISALEHWQSNTCVQFEENPLAADRIVFTKQDGCWSYVGRIGGAQEISIGSGCAYLGTVAHEVGHAAGFYHEQSRPDRDSFVTILYENVNGGTTNGNFAKYGTNVINSLNIPYDVTSIMHYGKYYFSTNDLPTIITVDPLLQYKIGSRDSLSFQDIHLANVMYECDSECTEQVCQNGGYASFANGCDCLCPPGTTGGLCETIETSDSCSFVVDESESSSGTISSPNYPSPYSINDHCIIHFKGNSELTITFEHFELENPGNSCYDYVDIRRAEVDYYTSGERFCGTDNPGVVVESDGELLLVFYSDYSVTDNGYIATYEFNSPPPPPTTAAPPPPPPTTAAPPPPPSTTAAPPPTTTTEQPTTEMIFTTTECAQTAAASRRYNESAGIGFKYGQLSTWADVDGVGVANAYCTIKKGSRRYPSCLRADGTEFLIPNAGSVNFDVGYPKTRFMRDMDGDGKDDFCRCLKIGNTFSCAKAEADYFNEESELNYPPYNGTCKDLKVDQATGFIYP